MIGLKEFFLEDPFDGFQPVFSGISPKLKVELKNTRLQEHSAIEKYLGLADRYYDVYKDGKLLNQNSDLAIGDVLTFKFNDNGINELHKNAYKPTRLDSEYTITTSDAASFIVSSDELQDVFFEEIQEQAESIIKAFLADRRITKPYEYEGMYFLTPKAHGWQQVGWGSYYRPKMYLVYSYIETDNLTDTVTTKYKAVRVTNFINEKLDDTAAETGEAITPNQTVNYSNIELVGTNYNNLDSLFLDLVESEVEFYTYENLID
ncbi:MAG TPA: hypothetical protein GXZ74_01635 [Tissierellia bacterium]|nr:hypothetical protein [Tissierellia bacterium]